MDKKGELTGSALLTALWFVAAMGLLGLAIWPPDGRVATTITCLVLAAVSAVVLISSCFDDTFGIVVWMSAGLSLALMLLASAEASGGKLGTLVASLLGTADIEPAGALWLFGSLASAMSLLATPACHPSWAFLLRWRYGAAVATVIFVLAAVAAPFAMYVGPFTIAIAAGAQGVCLLYLATVYRRLHRAN